MRRIACALGALFVGAAFVSCGPPPATLHGDLQYSNTCTVDPPNSFACPNETGTTLSGSNGDNQPPLVVSCNVTSGTGGQQVRFTICESTTGVCTEGRGISMCIQDGNANADAHTGSVTVFFNGDNTSPLPVGTTCQVHMDQITTSNESAGFSGHLSCTNAPSGTTNPPHLFNIAGTAQTMSPSAADFTFTTCTQNFIPGPC